MSIEPISSVDELPVFAESARIFRPEPLTDPIVTLSRHPARTIA
jgi:hypothetical protein